MNTVSVLQPADVGSVLQERMCVSKFTVHRNDTYSEIFHTSLKLIVILCSAIIQKRI
jgi:hypothetical protein